MVEHIVRRSRFWYSNKVIEKFKVSVIIISNISIAERKKIFDWNRFPSCGHEVIDRDEYFKLTLPEHDINGASYTVQKVGNTEVNSEV